MVETEINEMTELANALKQLNKDDYDHDRKVSGLDMRTRLNSVDIRSATIIDTLISLDVYPEELRTLTATKKRLNVSFNGLGRKEIIQLVSGVLDQQQKTNPFASLFGQNQTK